MEDALFHCQQAAEKALKAFLTFHNQPFRKTHNLEEIGEACLAIDPTLGSAVDEAVPLTEYAWIYRYPGPTASPTREEAEEARSAAGICTGQSSIASHKRSTPDRRVSEWISATV